MRDCTVLCCSTAIMLSRLRTGCGRRWRRSGLWRRPMGSVTRSPSSQVRSVHAEYLETCCWTQRAVLLRGIALQATPSACERQRVSPANPLKLSRLALSSAIVCCVTTWALSAAVADEPEPEPARQPAPPPPPPVQMPAAVASPPRPPPQPSLMDEELDAEAGFRAAGAVTREVPTLPTCTLLGHSVFTHTMLMRPCGQI